MTRLAVRRKGNPSRPWCVFTGPIVLANFPTWGEAIRFAGRYTTITSAIEMTPNHNEQEQE